MSYIYIYTLSYFKKVKKDAQPQKIRARSESYITKNKSGTIYLVPPPYYHILRLIKKIHICVSQNYSVVVVSASGNGG